MVVDQLFVVEERHEQVISCQELGGDERVTEHVVWHRVVWQLDGLVDVELVALDAVDVSLLSTKRPDKELAVVHVSYCKPFPIWVLVYVFNLYVLIRAASVSFFETLLVRL